MMTALADYPEISHVQRFSTKPGMIKTDDAFQGMVLKESMRFVLLTY